MTAGRGQKELQQMVNRTLWFAAAFSVVGLAGCAGSRPSLVVPSVLSETAAPVPTTIATAQTSMAVVSTVESTPPFSIFSRVNAERHVAGLPPVLVDATLTNIAAMHSIDQASTSALGHVGSDGSSLGQRMALGGYRGTAYAENVAAGFPDGEAVVDGWLASEGHRANILGPYQHIGVSVAFAADGTPYWTMVLGRP